MSQLPKSIIGIPGNWNSHSEIVESIALHSGGYLFAGMILMNTETKWSCTVDIYDHDPNMRQAFDIAGNRLLSEEELDAIADHRYTFYLVSEGGSLDKVRQLAQAASAILDCGGLGVKVESAGLAHSPEVWRELCENGLSIEMMYAFVTYAGDSGSYYSCGMQNIGHRDSVVIGDIDPHGATDLLFAFNKYIAIENAVIADGETFSTSADAPRFRVHKNDCTEFSPTDLFYNPYGVYTLTFA